MFLFRGGASLTESKLAPALPAEQTGRTFSRLFGGPTSLQELLIRKRKLMGPCWLDVTHAQLVGGARQSWCALEYVVASPKHLAVLSAGVPPPAPPMVVASLAIKTVVNAKTGANEVVALSAVCHAAVAVDAPTPNAEAALRHFTAVREVDGRPLPINFAQYCQQKRGFDVKTVLTEASLLTAFLGKWHLVNLIFRSICSSSCLIVLRCVFFTIVVLASPHEPPQNRKARGLGPGHPGGPQPGWL